MTNYSSTMRQRFLAKYKRDQDKTSYVLLKRGRQERMIFLHQKIFVTVSESTYQSGLQLVIETPECTSFSYLALNEIKTVCIMPRFTLEITEEINARFIKLKLIEIPEEMTIYHERLVGVSHD